MSQSTRLKLATAACLLAACSVQKATNVPPADVPDPGVTDPGAETDSPPPQDANPDDSAPPPCIDEDKDGYGQNCPKGYDCDDTNPYFALTCPNCNDEAVEGCPCTNASPKVPCYGGPAWTRGWGVCAGGERACVDGFYGGCNGEVLPSEEECNQKDDDCDGETDEGTSAACGSCIEDAECVESGPQTHSTFYPEPQENSSSVSLNSEGAIILNNKGGGKVEEFDSHFIWVANSGENTVSRLDTETGWETGRYYVCIDPSRTSVDSKGDVWVGCRGDGTVAKIALDEKDCIDLNQNGSIETSSDVNGDHVINKNDPKELLPLGQDECVVVKVQPYDSGAAPRGVAADKTGDVWVGFWSNNKIARLAGDTGKVLAEVTIAANPYGIALDQKGDVWVSGRGGNMLVRVDTNQDPPVAESLTPPFECVQLYGIAVDTNGNVWLANSECPYVLAYLPDSEEWMKVDIDQSKGYTRGVAASQSGIVYFAHNSFGCGAMGDSVTLVNAESFVMTDNIDLGPGTERGPVGVALDTDGYLWTVNQCTNSASRIDTKTGEVVGEYPVGTAPYTYSDMTGYALKTIGLFQGYYRHVLESDLDGPVKWTTISIAATIPSKTHISVRLRSAETKEELAAKEFSSSQGPFPPGQFPVDLTPLGLTGHMLEVEVNLYSSKHMATPVLKGINALAVKM